MNRLVYDSVEPSPLYEVTKNSSKETHVDINIPKKDSKDKEDKYNVNSQIEELNKLKISFSKKLEGDQYNRERSDGTLPP